MAGPDLRSTGWVARVRATHHPPLVPVVAAVLAALLACVPLFFVLGYAVTLDPHRAWELLWRPRVGELLGNTVRLVVVATAAAAVLGTGAAWLTERTTLPCRRLLAALLAAPLAVPAFVNGFAWVSLTSAAEGFTGAVWVVTLSYYPFVYLPVSAALRGLDPALEETARSLGTGPVRIVTRVVLPQLRPALFGGALLVALHLLAEFGAFQMTRFQTFTTAIFTEYESSFDGPAANMLATVLLLLCLLLLVAEVRVRGRDRLARIGTGVARTGTRARLGRATPLALLGVLALLTAGIGVPLASLGYWLTQGSSTAFPIAELAAATWSSVRLGLLGALVAAALALPVAVLAVRHRGRIATALERVTYLPRALPGIIVALSLVLVTLKTASPLYQSTALLVTAYVIMFLPLAIVGARAGLAQAPPALEDAARSLGSGPVRTALRVTVPLVARGLGAGAALVFLQVVTELTATLLLAPIGTHTLATRFWAYTGSVSYGAAAPYAVLMVLLSVPATYLLARGFGADRR